jgi:pseudaminic acid cytidylyltransferase
VADIAISYGAEVPFMRPEASSCDFVGTGPATQYSIEFCT